jgi:hypothetical protein
MPKNKRGGVIMAKKEDNKVVEKIIVERKYTNEITPIQAILPIVMEEIERKRKKYIEEHPEEFKK